MLRPVLDFGDLAFEKAKLEFQVRNFFLQRTGRFTRWGHAFRLE